jgi:hypothetical protein
MSIEHGDKQWKDFREGLEVLEKSESAPEMTEVDSIHRCRGSRTTADFRN